jgi:glycosyltransferase involved in cell wall biosynthesis
MVGGGDEAENLARQAEDLGIANSVVFTGRVHHSEVQRYYSLIDVLVYPRLKIRLTDLVTPLKPLEAMAQNKIVIASDIGGHNELITDGVTGDLFRADDPKALAETVLRVTDNRDNWHSRRKNGRQFVETERSWEFVVDRYKDVYGRLAPGLL